MHEDLSAEIRAYFASPAPRTMSAPLQKALLGRKWSSLHLLFACFWFPFFSFFSTFLFPIRIIDDQKLKAGPTESVQGKITSATPTKFSINETEVYTYQFTFDPDGAGQREATAYTTGKRWNPGETVMVRYLPSAPELAAPHGARLGKTDPAVLVLFLFFPGAGILFLWLPRRAWKNREFLLNHGLLTSATIDKIEGTNVSINDHQRFKIALTRTNDTLPLEIRTHDPAQVDLAKRSVGKCIPILVHPRDPNKVLFLEL